MSDNFTMGEYGNIRALEKRVEELERDLAIVCHALRYNTSRSGYWSLPDLDRIAKKWRDLP